MYDRNPPLWTVSPEDEAVGMGIESGREHRFTDEGGTEYCPGPPASSLFSLFLFAVCCSVPVGLLMETCDFMKTFLSLLREGILYQVFPGSSDSLSFP